MVIFLAAMLLATGLGQAFAGPIGFGYVNNKDVALRRGIGGKTIVRLPENTCVWVLESKNDKKGTLWYHIRAGLNVDHTNVDYTGWMKAEFINAGEQVWHDVTAVSASGGMMALRSDGTCETAGRPISYPDGWISPRGWDQSYDHVKQVLASDWGMEYMLITEDGTFHSTFGANPFRASRFRLLGRAGITYGITADNRLLRNVDEEADRHSWIYPAGGLKSKELAHIVAITGSYCRTLLLSDAGEIYVVSAGEDLDALPEPDWENWTDIVSVDAYTCSLGLSKDHSSAAYVAVRSDGTVLAAPQELANVVGGWTDMRAIRLNPNWILGLRNDGTAVTVGLGKTVPPDVSGWTEITDIAAGGDFCVGIRKDGTLSFAGEHIFMGEGHNRK